MIKPYIKYLEALKTFDDYVTIREWAEKIVELYPEELEEAKKLYLNDDRKPLGKLIKAIPTRINNKECKAAIEKEKIDNLIKYTYIPEDQRIDVEDKKAEHQSKNPRGVKTINFKELMKAIEYLPDDYGLPQREEYSHFENNGQCVGYKEYIALEMAVRNPSVIDITKKLDYIDEIIEKYPRLGNFKDWIRGIEDWEDKFEDESPELIIDVKQKKEYISNANLSIDEFIKEIDFLDIEREHITKESQVIINLKIIADYLQNILVKKYCIYKDGYFFIKDTSEFDPDIAVDCDSFQKHDFNTSKLDKYNKSVTDRIVKSNEDNMKEIADMFFMYDYLKFRKEDNSTELSALDIKCELTKYHGIEIESLKEKFTYDECLERYEEFKNLEANFIDGEKTISNKIKYMIDFIDNEQYKFILFY